MVLWKKYGLLLGGLGFSHLGNWIYVVALNLFVLHLTGSAAAVAGIYIVGPIARILTNFVAGSIIDRSNKRKLMIAADIVRGIIVFCLPFMDSIWLIYALLFCANIASSFFGPSSTYYKTKFVAQHDRKRFNAILGTFNSGSFLIGPAIAGVLIMSFNTMITIWVNSFTFFVCALAIYYLPNVDEQVEEKRQSITWQVLKADFKVVTAFARTNRMFIKIFLLFQCTLMIAFALDSQEVTFIKQDLAASDSLYGLIVSIAGLGAIVGGIVAAALTKKISLKSYLGFGMLFTMLFYTAFYASWNIWIAIVSFIALGFFMAFSNTGYETFYQNNVPPEMMGRFGSVTSIFQSVLQVIFTLLLGVFADVFSLQVTAISFGIISILLASLLFVSIFSKQALHIVKD
ncbi:MFS transporter [Solibacillus sp. CAU 1738]|uniref:MFS transporter n=1 Tax=Solibacillus sp. CAU 1738 TaxID=3140363 RepID=UPI0032600AB2